MKYNCEIIRDLIPLYIDDVASPSTRLMVDEHLEECEECRKEVSRMRNDEAEQVIATEKEEVIATQRKFFKRKSAMAGSVIAGLFMIPILVCLIVNLTSGEGLGWFFVVLAALMVAGSLSVVPLMVPGDKGIWTLGSFAASLILLFGVCNIYNGGSCWFFIASTAVLFGLSLFFMPFVARSRFLAQVPAEYRGILVLAADTIFYALMMLAIGLHVMSLKFFVISVSISAPIIAIILGIFFLVRRSRAKKALEHPANDAASGFASYHANESASASQLPQAGTASHYSQAGTARPAYANELGGRRKLGTREIVLLIVGSPIWVPLAIAGFATVFALYISVWAILISFWAVFASFAVGAPASIAMGIGAIIGGRAVHGTMLICAGVVLAGLAILTFFGCKALTTAVVKGTKKIALWIGSLINGRKAA